MIWENCDTIGGNGDYIWGNNPTLPSPQVFVTQGHRFNTLGELVHHHSIHADGLVTTLLYPGTCFDSNFFL